MAEVQEGGYEELYIPRAEVSFDPGDPDPGKMDEETIAHGLATEYRYGGHTDPLVNVAQHAVDTVALLEEMGYGSEVQFYGLHHDSAEAYLGDSQKPNKEAVPAMDEFEDIWQETIWDFLGLGTPDPEQSAAVKEADSQLYLYEVENLFSNQQHAEAAGRAVKVEDWSEKQGVRDLDEIIDLERTYEKSKEDFLTLHRQLASEI